MTREIQPLLQKLATFDSNEVSDLVGITPIHLNTFVERNTYGVRPSVRRGKGRGGRRLFSADDVFGIALVWWLFESGLRPELIRLVLNEVCKPASGVATAAGKKLVEQEIQIVRIQSEPRRMSPGLKMPRQFVHLIVEENPNMTRGISIKLDIPVGHFYSMLLDKMRNLAKRGGE